MLSQSVKKFSNLVVRMTAEAPNYWTRNCEAQTKAAVPGEVVGNIPTWLNGRLIRNGPGEKCIGDSYFNHLFDGMAVLHMVNIQDGKASYTSRWDTIISHKNIA